MRRLRLRSIALALAALVAAPLLVALRLGEFDANTVEWAVDAFPEPSDVAWHPLRRTMFLVGDEGDIGEVSLDGKLLRRHHVGGDLEALAIDPTTGLLYVGRETHEIILELDPGNFRILRRFTIDRSFEGNPDFLRRGGDGIEGLAFVPDDSDPEGGSLWAVNQFDPPVLVRLSIPLRSSKEKFLPARIVRAIPIDLAPLSGVSWDPRTREFLVVSALWKKAVTVALDGRVGVGVRVPGFLPEGLVALPDGRFVVAEDAGGLIEWKPATDPFRAAAEFGPPAPEAAAARAGAGEGVPATLGH